MNYLLFPHITMKATVATYGYEPHLKRLEGKTEFVTSENIYIINTKIPNDTGVYCFYDNYGVALYIGSSINLNKRIHSSFLQRRKQAQIKYIGYCVTDALWKSRITEAVLIHKYKPILNKSYKFNAGITSDIDFSADSNLDVNQLEKYEVIEKSQFDLFTDIINIAKGVNNEI